MLEAWLRSYRPEELFDERGALRPELRALAPDGDRRMSANPNANGGLLLRDLDLPDFRDYAVPVERPAADRARRCACSGGSLPTSSREIRTTSASSAPTRPRPTGSAMSSTSTDRVGRRDPPGDDNLAPDGPRRGGAVRAPVPGLARGLSADRQARRLHLLRGLHPHRRLDVQPARQVAEGDAGIPWRRPIASLNYLLELACLASGPQRLLASGPGLHRSRDEQEGGGRPRLSAARRQHAAERRRSLPAQPELRQRRRRRQAARVELPLDGRRSPPLHARDRDLGLGVNGCGR